MNKSKTGAMKYRDELDISPDFKKVKYDGRVYNVRDVKILPAHVTNPKHRCTDGCIYSVNFHRYITYNNQVYYVSFCNKCKTLFICPAHDI